MRQGSESPIPHGSYFLPDTVLFSFSHGSADFGMAPGAGRRLARHLGTQPSLPVAQPMGPSTDHAMLAPTRNVRKRTVNNFLKKYKVVSNVKPRIVIERGMTQPVGDWSQVWVTEVNIIVRQNAPLLCHDWRKLDKETKRQLFNEPISNTFDIDLHLDYVEDAVHKYVGHRLKDFRCKLHKHYLKQGDDIRVRRAKPYDGVTQENWELICNWFEDPEFKHKSDVNIANRKAQLVNHCAGSVSFVRFAAKKVLGIIGLYRETHFSDKRDQWVAPLAEERHDAMVNLQNQANNTAENSPPPNEDEIAVAVLGEKCGYTRGLGHGVMPPSSSSSRHNVIVEELQRNVEDANRRLEQAERRNAELLRQVQALQSWQAQMEDAFISGFGPGASSCAQWNFGGNSSRAQT